MHLRIYWCQRCKEYTCHHYYITCVNCGDELVKCYYA